MIGQDECFNLMDDELKLNMNSLSENIRRHNEQVDAPKAGGNAAQIGEREYDDLLSFLLSPFLVN